MNSEQSIARVSSAHSEPNFRKDSLATSVGSEELLPSGEGDLELDISKFEATILNFLGEQGLPKDEILATTSTRMRVLSNFEDVIETLTKSQKSESFYLTKFVIAISAGLVDAALNYLWDETIAQLRAKIVDYDLSYFFGQVTQDSKRLNELRTAEDLSKVTDHQTLTTCKNIGLISELGFKELDLVREMRNHASAAHPNQNDLRPMQLLYYLETCIDEVIAVPLNGYALAIKRMLATISHESLDASDLNFYRESIENLDEARVESFAIGLFGIATNPNVTEMTARNVLMLWPIVWPLTSEALKKKLGGRLGIFKAGMEGERYDRAKELFDSVDALSYIPDSLRAGQIHEAVQTLESVHYNFNNFHNEPAPAKLLANLVRNAPVPEEVSEEYTKIVVKAFIGNGYGVSTGAVESYKEMISNFGQRECNVALAYLLDVEIASALVERGGGVGRFHDLLEAIRPRIHSTTSRELLELMKGHPAPDKMHLDSELERYLRQG